MKPIRLMLDDSEEHFPMLLTLLLWALLIPIRIVVLLLLPMGSAHQYHKLHKVFEFWRFE